MRFITFYLFIIVALGNLLSGCAPQPPIPSPGHLNAASAPAKTQDIPPLVQSAPFVPLPQPSLPSETYTVVVTDVAVDKLLFALARDAKLNVDIHPGIQGRVTVNAIEQTLPQILDRISRQVDLRYEIKDGVLTFAPDLPYLHSYKVNYVNMSRDSKSEIKISTQISSTGSAEVGQGQTQSQGGGNDGNTSNTEVKNTSNNRFWETLTTNIKAIVGIKSETSNAQNGQEDIIVSPESGILTVRATHKQHAEIQSFLDKILSSVQRQVLIEATIAEVRLGDRYQAGIDWKRIDGDYTYVQSMTGSNMQPLTGSPIYGIAYHNAKSIIGDITATIRLLEQFGNVKVLSSPKLMVLNNQTAILKVVDNVVYFTMKVEYNETDTRTRQTYTTTINTVPVGLVMNVTPQISDNDMVILNVRPTISRVLRYTSDPNPILAQGGTENLIPEIQVREIESVLRVNNGNVAIIGGLMEDNTTQNKTGVPLLSDLPLVGDLFSYRDEQYTKTELVIFLRPIVVKDASIQGDLKEYQSHLPTTQPSKNAPTGLIRR
ncbi:MAG: pilus (MSHA type) biogenesis protein MshL [Thiotrichaceae bacterium]